MHMSLSPGIIVLFSTAPPDKSEILARMLIDKRLVACVNVVPVHSYYHWNGEVCSEPEHLLIAKTTQEKAEEVIAELKAHHPYEVPEIIALPVSGGHLPYLEWVHQETVRRPINEP
jgi:periplasmic divalent cation tolerance protein